MTDPDAKQTLQLLRTMCAKEHALFEDNLPLLIQKFKDMFDHLLVVETTNSHSSRSPSLVYMHAFDRTVDCLTSTTNLLRKLNIHVQTILQTELGGGPRAAAVAPPPAGTQMCEPIRALLPDTAAGDCATPSDGDVVDVVDVPLTIADLVPDPADRSNYCAKYKRGTTSVAIVSHLMAATVADHTIAYLIDTSTGGANSSTVIIKPDECRRLPATHVPPSHPTLFGVSLDGVVFRARRLPQPAPLDAATIAVMLIDTGETVRIAPAQTPLYQLPDAHGSAQAQAMPCQVLACESFHLLRGHLYGRVCFEVLDDVRPDSAFVSVIVALEVEPSAPTAAAIAPDSTSTRLAPNNPFAPLIEQSAERQQQQLSSDSDTVTSSTNIFTAKYASISAAERAQLFDTDLAGGGAEAMAGTTNALVAVTGYAPLDDERICRHYDPATGGCFKGGACRREHVAPLRDGWTRDQRIVCAQQRVQQPWPPVGARTILRATHLVHVDRFYAQIVSDTLHDPRTPTMWEMTRGLNAQGAQLRRLDGDGAPGEQELVLARYHDGMWHRARVVEVFGAVRDAGPETAAAAAQAACVRVFFVDFGNCATVRLEDLRRWSERWDWVPFQAYECRLAGVQRLDGAPLGVAEMVALRGLMLNKELRATVINNMDALVVRLLDSNDVDLSTTICAMGLAQSAADGADVTQTTPIGGSHPFPV